jgi:hypothetical protein
MIIARAFLERVHVAPVPIDAAADHQANVAPRFDHRQRPIGHARASGISHHPVTRAGVRLYGRLVFAGGRVATWPGKISDLPISSKLPGKANAPKKMRPVGWECPFQRRATGQSQQIIGRNSQAN